MKESIEFPVVLPNDLECDVRLCVDTDNNVFDIIVDDKIICSGDWCENLRIVLIRALEIWDVNNPD